MVYYISDLLFIILVILIYVYVIEYMYENFIFKVKFKYGMDIGSLFLRFNDVNKIDKRLFGDKFG